MPSPPPPPPASLSHPQYPQPLVPSSSHSYASYYPSGPSSTQPAALDDSQKKRKAEEEFDHPAPPSAPSRPSGGSSARVVACSECKRLKIKCDRIFPCTNCRRRGLATICPDGELKGGKGRRLILASTEDLHLRIAKLEAALQDEYSRNTRTTHPHPLLEASHHYEPLSDDDQQPASTSPTSRGKAREVAVKQEQEIVEEEVLDNFGTLTLGEEAGVSRFHSNAASIYLVTEDAQAEPRASEPEPADSADIAPSPQTVDFHTALVLDATDPLIGSPSSSAGRSTMESLLANLPSKEEAWAISEAYFQNGAWTYDPISRARFYDEYLARVYSDQQEEEPSPQRLAVVLLVFALGSLFDLNSPPQSKASKRFFSMAKTALGMDSTASLTFIRAIMLLSNYVMHHADHFASSGEISWSLLGLASRSAQALGLHRDGSNWGLSASEVGERRQIFWELYAYDCLQSINLGRPRAIPAASIDTKLPQPTFERTNLYPTYKYRFMEIMTQINDLQTSTRARSYETCLQIDRAIRVFEKDLPPELHISIQGVLIKADDEDPEARSFFLQKQTLRLVINMGQLYLHRTWFARALRDHPEEPLRSKYAQSYVALLEASKSLVQVLRDVLTLHIPLVTRFWFFFLHAFSATVNLAAAVIRAPASSLASAALAEVELAVSLFEIAHVGSRAREELPHLRRLRDRARNQLRSTSQPHPFYSLGLPSSPQKEVSELGTETKLQRQPLRRSSEASSSSSHASNPLPHRSPARPPLQAFPFPLPTTFEAATNSGTDADHQAFVLSGGWDAQAAEGMWGMGMGGMGAGSSWSEGPVSGGSSGGGSGTEDPLQPDFDFDAFLRGLGIDPRAGEGAGQ